MTLPDEMRLRGRHDPADLYDLAPCALLSTLPSGEIVRANRTFYAWLGATADEVLGQVRLQALLTMGSRIYYETHYAPLLLMQGFVSEIALELHGKDGRICPVVASATQERDASGTVIMHHVALFDSSDRRRYERELLEARKHAELVSRELKSADRMKNEFIAMLAHELRNPLAPLRTAIELQRRRDAADHVVNKTGEMMQRQVGQLARLVDDLLDVTRLSQDKLTLHQAPVDLASVVHHAIEANEPLLQRSGLAFEPQLPAAPVYVEVDAARLVQAISNILNNATKFTPAPGVISLALERDGDEALIRIRDTGIGIEAEKLSSVFEMFMQAAPSAERQGGLGIGLTLAQSLVERHGGRITVRSEGLGCGAEFTIHLPVLRATPQSILPSRTRHEVNATPRRVLVVDDNRDSTELIALLLELHGHEVQQAYDGLTAVELSATFQPDVVILDIGLPGLSGHQAAQRIRAQAGKQPTLIALTGWGQEEDYHKSDQAGFDAHLVKPVDHDVLTQLIVELPRRDEG